jgi:predicted RecA/RadA family phage recombinase
MATYKLIEIATGNVENLVLWDGISEYEVPSGYELLELTSSIEWDGNYGAASSSMSTPYSGLFQGRLYGSASYALTASYALNSTGINLDNVDHITFDTTPTATPTIGTLVWDDGNGTLDLGLKGGNVELKVGQQQYAMAYNAETESLLKGTVVYISGSQGQRIAIKKASAQSEGLSANTIGFVAETITAGSEGFILLSGVLPKMNTTASLEGSLLYLSETPGLYTTAKPVAPVHTVILGFIQHSHQSAGSIFVKIDNGYELGELHNVLTNGASTGDLLNYSGNVWTHTKILTGSYKLSGSLDVSGSITASLSGSLNGSVTGFFSGSSTGSFTGSFYGKFDGIKAGSAAIGSVQQNIGGEYIYNIIFDNSYVNSNYSVSVNGTTDLRVWTVENKTINGFRINSNDNTPTTGDVLWIAIPYNS